MKFVKFLFLVFVLFVSSSVFVSAQAEATAAECGAIIESEFTENDQVHQFAVELDPGDTLDVSITPLGDLLSTVIALVGPSGVGITVTNSGNLSHNPAASSGVVSARGNYTVFVSNTFLYPDGRAYGGYNGGVGIYTLYIGCTLRDTTVIAPGDAPSSGSDSGLSGDATVVVTPAFSGFGFPGIAPVDFSSAFRLPLTLGVASEGEIPVTGNAILGFYFTGSANSLVEMSFERVSGNLNLGLVVLSADNRIAYMAALVSSEAMTSRFRLPSDGEYTVGLFRIDLVPPIEPTATRFRVSLSVGA